MQCFVDLFTTKVLCDELCFLQICRWRVWQKEWDFNELTAEQWLRVSPRSCVLLPWWQLFPPWRIFSPNAYKLSVFCRFPKRQNIWEVHGLAEFKDKHGNQLAIIRYCVHAISKLLASTSADYGNDRLIQDKRQPDAWWSIHYSNLGFLAPILGAGGGLLPLSAPPWLYACAPHRKCVFTLPCEIWI